MADEQDVFLSGISGSIQQWSTEATATKMEATLQKISASNSAMTQLLTAIKNGEGTTQKQLSKAVNATRNQTKATQAASKKETTQTQQTHGLLKNISQTVKDGWSGSSGGIIDQLRKNQIQATRLEKDTQRLISAGMSREDAEKTLIQEERTKKQFDFFKAALIPIVGLALSAEEATLAGMEERFDMASELRQSGLFASLSELNTGFISIAQTISETGFTFGQAAEFTKRFSEAVGVTGVKGTLDFVSQMARGPGGIMEQFNMEFGQVAHISGEYIDSLRIAGQLRGRDEQQLRQGMDSFMSNVQATSNVLKISMEEAASLLKNSLDEEQRGMLLTLPEEMRRSLQAGMEFAGGLKNPLGDLIATRLGAGQNQFLQTQQYQDMTNSMAGIELIKFAESAASILETQGDDAFQSFMANQSSDFISGLIDTFSSGQNRGVAFTDGTMTLLAQLAEMQQNIQNANAGISGGGDEDDAMRIYRDQQVQAENRREMAMGALMPDFVKNVRELTETNRNFAETAAEAIISQANLIDQTNNAATNWNRVVTGTGTFLLDVLQFPGRLVDFASQGIFGTNIFSNDTRTIQDFTSGSSGGLRTMSNDQSESFASYSNDMIDAIQKNTEADIKERQAAALSLKNTILSAMGTDISGAKDTDAIVNTNARLLAKLNQLLSQLGE